jgi:hypothetical protein
VNAGVVDQNVDATESLAGLRRDPFGGLGVRHVPGHGQRPATRCRDGRLDLGELLRTATHQRDRRALADEKPRRRRTETGSGPGDHRYPAVELPHSPRPASQSRKTMAWRSLRRLDASRDDTEPASLE